MSTATHKFPLWATMLTVVGLIILITLGTWQLQRLAWKTDMIDKLEAAYSQSDVRALDLSDETLDYAYGSVSGQILTAKAFLLGPPSMKDEKPGYHLIIPLQMEGAERTLLIDMGWTGDDVASQNLDHATDKTITIHGLIKRSRWNAFTPANIPEKNVWYRLDTEQIAQSMSLNNLYPAKMLADRADHDFGAAYLTQDNTNRPTPNNNHLQYALFWYAMAAALAVIFSLRFVVKARKA